MKIENLKMTFDQLQRYRLTADLIEAVRGRGSLTILDAGSHQGYLASFLPGDTIYNLDRNDFTEINFLQVCSKPTDNGNDLFFLISEVIIRGINPPHPQ